MKKETTACPLCHNDNPPDAFFCAKCGTNLGLKQTPKFSKTMTMMTPSPELQRGKLFAGRYEVIEALGRGGMGSVYRVEDKKVGEEVALKLINPEIARDERIIERFSHELKVARRISHRNVCRMYDLGEAEGSHFITMEYVQGEDLKSLITRIGRLPEDKALAVARQAADGLSEAHHLGIVHRDLKPGNIMVDREGNAKIMDFGIARSTKSKVVTATGLVIGTPDYMSPEQAEAGEVDGRSDIYSLGVILYEMTTGQIPFEGETALAVAMKHKSERPRDPRELNPQLSAAASRLVLKCLEKEKEKRFQTAADLGAAIEAIAGAATSAPRSGTFRRTIPSREITVTFKLRRYLVPALAVVVLAAAGLVLWRTVLKPAPATRSVAVIHFLNQTGDPAFDYLRGAIPNLLITSLEQSQYLQVTTFERLRDLLRQSGKTDIETIDTDLGFELCGRDNVEALVLGSYVKAGETFATNIKIFDVKTRKTIKSFTARGEGAQSILDRQIAQLSREISRGVGLSRNAVDETAPKMAQSPTSSMDAYMHYLAGHEKFEKFYFNDARKDLEKAVELDPRFAAAYYDLSKATFYLGDMPASSAALTKAGELAARAPEKDRLYIQSALAWRREGDQEKRLRIFQEIAAKYPREKEIHLELARMYSGKKMFPEAFAEADKALVLDPKWAAMLNTLGFIHIAAGDPAKGEEVLKRAAAAVPGDANLLDSLGSVCYGDGRLDEAISYYKKALQVKPDLGSEEIIAYIETVRGNYSEAQTWIDQFILMAADNDSKARGYWWKAVFDHLSGRRGRAIAELEQLRRFPGADKNPQLASLAPYADAVLAFDRADHAGALRSLARGQETVLGYFRSRESAFAVPLIEAVMTFERELVAGFIAAREGRLDAARRNAEAAAAEWPKSKGARLGRDNQLAMALVALRAEIHVLEGKPDEAVALMEKEFRPGIPGYGPPYFPLNHLFLNFPLDLDVTARAYEKMGDIGKAIGAYEGLVRFDPKSRDRRMLNPIFSYRLAKLYEKNGQKAKAGEQFREFLEHWANADPGIPELVDAKKRLGSRP